jgi:seryl-tRNA synthetase
MIDIKLIREQPDIVKAAAKNKNADVTASDIDDLIKLDAERRRLMNEVETTRRERNEIAERGKKGKPSPADIERGKKVKDQLAKHEEELAKVDAKFTKILKLVPNIPTADVPIGRTEDENVVAKKVGEPKKFDFKPLNHWQIAEKQGWIDKERAAKVTGARFAYLKGNLVRLQFSMMMFVVDRLTSEEVIAQIAGDNKLTVSHRPFIPVLPPYMIRTEMFDAMDRLEPKEERYKIEGQELWLQGSAEHVLGSMHAGEILNEKDLPLRYLGFATSFRGEAGTYGKDMEGIFRMHQFDKMEMESFTCGRDSLNEHLLLIGIQEYIMKELEIPYQLLMKCTADIGKPNARGVDVEAWLPGQDKYRETHTADYMTDYQTRRLGIRVRLANGETELAHTNDATAMAMGRTLVAIIENYQQEDGSVRVPKVLQKYYGGETV